MLPDARETSYYFLCLICSLSTSGLSLIVIPFQRIFNLNLFILQTRSDQMHWHLCSSRVSHKTDSVLFFPSHPILHVFLFRNPQSLAWLCRHRRTVRDDRGKFAIWLFAKREIGAVTRKRGRGNYGGRRRGGGWGERGRGPVAERRGRGERSWWSACGRSRRIRRATFLLFELDTSPRAHIHRKYQVRHQALLLPNTSKDRLIYLDLVTEESKRRGRLTYPEGERTTTRCYWIFE